MTWSIKYSAEARQDLRSIFECISFELLEPESAKAQVLRIMEQIHLLNEMPYRHSLYGKEPWQGRGLRFVPTDNYLIFYVVSEDNRSVNIVRIMYGGRDLQNQLSETSE